MSLAAHDPHPYEGLTPDAVITAVEATGRLCDGHQLALNSYENRVYQVGLEEADPVIVKFYRPGRWSRDQILEEHAFTLELQDAGLQVVAPLVDDEGRSLHAYGDFLFAVYPRRGGHAPEPGGELLGLLGRSLGRLHAVAAGRRFRYRATLDLEQFGEASREFLLRNDFIPAELVPAYESLSDQLLQRMRQLLADFGTQRRFRLHGDCHVGNLLWRGEQLWFVDFDDCMNGPAVQDLWMLLAGERDQQLRQLSELIEGYSMFHDFHPGELVLIETLRTLRVMHYSAWLARRWSDPAFPHSFPWFNTGRYWSEHILALREQRAALDEPPLVLY